MSDPTPPPPPPPPPTPPPPPPKPAAPPPARSGWPGDAPKVDYVPKLGTTDDWWRKG